MPFSSVRTARLGALAAIVFWGISFVATKAVLREIGPVTLITIRFALGVLFLNAVLAARERDVWPPRAFLPGLALMGFVGVLVHQMLQAWGLTMTTAMNTGWLIGLIPIWTSLLAARFRGERFGLVRISGLVLGLCGTLLVISRGDFSAAALALPSARGDFLVLISTLNWAIYTVIGHATIRALGPLRATTWSMTLGWLMLLPFFVHGHGWSEITHLTATGWLALVFLGVACSGLGYLFWYGALTRLDAGSVAAFLYLEPLVTLTAAASLLGEQIRAATVAGGLLLIAGVALVQQKTSVAGTGDVTPDS
jgi:drug/metabolite transporter (DMT)-like permease